MFSDTGIKTDGHLWPVLGDGEQEIGRWHASSVRLFIDQVPDPEWGGCVLGGSMGLLITDRSIRGTICKAADGKAAPLGYQGFRVTLYWPFELVGRVDLTSFQGIRPHVIVEDPIADGHLEMGNMNQPKGRKSDDFMPPAFAMKNRVQELHQQLSEGVQAFQGF